MTEEEKDEMAKKQATPEGQEELTRRGKELHERAQNMEQPKLPPTPPGSGTYEVKIRGGWQRSYDNGRRRGDRSDEKTMSHLVTTALQVHSTTGSGKTAEHKL